VPWSDISTAALRVSLATFMVYIISYTAIVVIDFAYLAKITQWSTEAVMAEEAFRAPWRQLVTNMSYVLLSTSVALACLCIFSLLAENGLRVAGYTGLAWCILFILISPFDPYSVFTKALPPGISEPLLALEDKVWPWFKGVPATLLILVSAALLATKAAQNNSLIRLSGAIGLPAAIIFMGFLTTTNTAILLLSVCAGLITIMDYHKRNMRFQIFVVLLALTAINVIPQSITELKIWLEVVSPHALVQPPYVTMQSTLLLLPLLVAHIHRPQIMPDLRSPLIALCNLALVSWGIQLWPGLRSGYVSFGNLDNTPQLLLPAHIPLIGTHEGITATAWLTFVVYLINAVLILWCYLQVWKAR